LGVALPARVKRQLAALQPQLYVVDARHVADAVGLGKRINMVMQTVFFQLSGVIPMDKVGGGRGWRGLAAASARARPLRSSGRARPQTVCTARAHVCLRAGNPAAEGVDRQGLRQEGRESGRAEPRGRGEWMWMGAGAGADVPVQLAAVDTHTT
jgi:hypothetical protein